MTSVRDGRESEPLAVHYEGDTLAPAVEGDVWEPEIVLARLRLEEGQ